MSLYPKKPEPERCCFVFAGSQIGIVLLDEEVDADGALIFNAKHAAKRTGLPVKFFVEFWLRVATAQKLWPRLFWMQVGYENAVKARAARQARLQRKAGAR